MRRRTQVLSERRNCPACSSKARSLYRCAYDEGPIGARVRSHFGFDPSAFGVPYELAQCKGCGLIFQRWVAGAELNERIYALWAGGDPVEVAVAERDAAAPLESRDGHELMSAAAYLRTPLNKLTTLDFGMGLAGWARVAKALGCQSYGTDIDPTAMSRARRHGITTIDDIPEHTFDFINTEQVLEHVTDLGPTLKKLARGLRPGGILKVSVPNGDRVSRSLTQWMMPVDPLEHINTFTHRAIGNLGARHGLKVVKPRMIHRYAFLASRGALPGEPKRLAKELIRPLYTWRSRTNLYAWLQYPTSNGM